MRTILYKGEQLPLDFSPVTILLFQRETGKSLADVITGDTLLLESILYHSLVRGAEKHGNWFSVFGIKLFKLKRFKYARKEVLNILDGCIEMFYRELVEETTPKEVKKK